MIKNECKIVRDLLLNYVENLLSDETNEFVDKHISNCDKCKDILKMIQDEKIKEEDIANKNEQYEVDGLKKYRKKMLILKRILIIILIAIIIASVIFWQVLAYRNNILTSAYYKIQEIKNEDNYVLTIEEQTIDYSTGQELYSQTKFYYKDGKYKEEHHGELKNDILLNANYYYLGTIDSNKRTEIYEDTKTVINRTSNYTFTTKGVNFKFAYTYANSYGINYGLIFRTCIRIRTERYKGKECYVARIQHNNTSYAEIWIDKETMLVLREINDIIDKQYYEKSFTLDIGNVKEEDISVPNLDEYTITEKEDLVQNSEILEDLYTNN